MPDTKPRLRAVGEAETSAAPAHAEPDGARFRAVWVLGVALLAALVALGVQTWRTGTLEAHIGVLSARLTASQAENEALREHLVRIREGIAGLQGELDALDALVADAPPEAARP